MYTSGHLIFNSTYLYPRRKQSSDSHNELLKNVGASIFSLDLILTFCWAWPPHVVHERTCECQLRSSNSCFKLKVRGWCLLWTLYYNNLTSRTSKATRYIVVVLIKGIPSKNCNSSIPNDEKAVANTLRLCSATTESTNQFHRK